MYRSVVCTEAWPSRNWICSSSPPYRWQRRAQLRPKIVRCQMVNAGSLSTPFDCIPHNVCSHASIPSRFILQNASEHSPLAHARMAEPNINKPLAPCRHGYGSQSSALANQIDNDPVALPQLKLIQSQTHDFRASQSTSEQQSRRGRRASGYRD
jgi:hypothetical protein